MIFYCSALQLLSTCGTLRFLSKFGSMPELKYNLELEYREKIYIQVTLQQTYHRFVAHQCTVVYWLRNTSIASSWWYFMLIHREFEVFYFVSIIVQAVCDILCCCCYFREFVMSYVILLIFYCRQFAGEVENGLLHLVEREIVAQK